MLSRLAVLIVALVACADRPVVGEEAFPKELVEWSPLPGNPIFQGAGGEAWDQKIRERGYILREGETYHLWYTGYNEDRSPLRLLGHATSPDGLHWSRDQSNPIFKGSWTEDVFVLKNDGRYLMFAEGQNDVAHQLASPDGLHWGDSGAIDIRHRDGAPIEPGPYGTPTVWFEKGIWSLFYERGDQGVWLATSHDRVIWTNVSDTPVLAKGPDAYDREAIALNQVVKRNGVYYAFYHANAHRPWKDWTSCVARSRDLVHWEKYPANPIVQGNGSSPILVATPEGDRLYTMHPEVRAYRNVKPVRVKD